MEQQRLNPAIVYVLAIIGLLCCCFGGLGVLLAAPAFFIAQSNLKKAAADPDNYDQASVRAMNTAKIIALVIMIINILYLIWSIYSIQAMGGWEAYMEQVNKMIEEMQKAQG